MDIGVSGEMCSSTSMSPPWGEAQKTNPVQEKIKNKSFPIKNQKLFGFENKL
jgi:hypothetical protein